MSTTLPTTEAEKQAFFANIVAQYSERLYWTVRRIVIDHDDADDVLQNVFVKAWSNMDDFQNRSKISTWLYRIAVNESLDFIRRKKDIASLGDEANVAVANRLMSDDYFGSAASSFSIATRCATRGVQSALLRRNEIFRHQSATQYFRGCIEGKLSHSGEEDNGICKESRVNRRLP